MLIQSVRHDWPERSGFLLARPKGRQDYTFLHFITPVKLRVNGQTFSVKPGGCIFYAPGTPQWFHCDVPLLHNWAHFSPELASKLSEYGLPADQVLYPRESAFISEIFRVLEAEFLDDRLFRGQRLQCQTEEFLLQLSRALKEDLAPMLSGAERKRLLAVRNHILSHTERQWTVKEMADMLPLSTSRFHAVYKSQFGTSPMRDLQEARIIRAKALLLAERDWTLGRIAESIGFADQYQFIRQFKQVTGLSPGAWRKKRV